MNRLDDITINGPSEFVKQIVGGLAKGMIVKDIAKEVFLGNRTVETYLRKLYIKHGAKNQPHLVAIFKDNKWI